MSEKTNANNRFQGKRILITGGTSGIGLAGARRILAEGGHVIITGRDESKQQALKQELPSAQVLINDAADPDAARQLASHITSPLDGIWFNAGYARIGALTDTTPDLFDQMMAVNVRAPFLQLSLLRHHLHAGSSIVLTSSSSVYEGNAATSVYAATKAALVAAARSWADELAPEGIRINTLIPGAIATDFRNFLPEQTRTEFEDSVVRDTPMRRIGTADEAAAVGPVAAACTAWDAGAAGGVKASELARWDGPYQPPAHHCCRRHSIRLALLQETHHHGCHCRRCRELCRWR